MVFYQKKEKKMLKINNNISVIVTLILSLVLVYLSYFGKTSEAYLFPKIISLSMLILSSSSLVLFFLKQDNFLKIIDVKKLYPYLISIILFVLFSEKVGFYFLATLLFISNCFIYSKKKNLRTSIEIFITTTLFISLVYFLFSVLLKVQVPRFFINIF